MWIDAHVHACVTFSRMGDSFGNPRVRDQGDVVNMLTGDIQDPGDFPEGHSRLGYYVDTAEPSCAKYIVQPLAQFGPPDRLIVNLQGAACRNLNHPDPPLAGVARLNSRHAKG